MWAFQHSTLTVRKPTRKKKLNKIEAWNLTLTELHK